jgi:hypothetical protein
VPTPTGPELFPGTGSLADGGRMATMPAVILAHQGGWDEIMMVGVPIVIVAGLLLLANRRAKAALRDQDRLDGEP